MPVIMQETIIKLWDECSEKELRQLSQLFDDMMPYYQRIAVYNIDKEFVAGHKTQCVRLALAARKVTLESEDVKPEEAIFSDEMFSKLITSAWKECFSDDDRVFFNTNLQQAAECFRMGIMMADLPQM